MMTTTVSKLSLSIANTARALDSRLGAIMGLKPSEFAECLHRANQMTRFAGDGGATLSPNQAQELRVMAGVDSPAK